MTEPVGRERAVRFLLGELPDDERDVLEERFFVEDDALAELKEAEDDLVDAYSRGVLSQERSRLFEARYLQDEPGQRRVAFARALSAAARRDAAKRPARAARVWPWAAAVTALALTGALLGLVRARSTLARLEGERSALARAAQAEEDRARGLADEVERLRTRVADLEDRLGHDLDRVVALTLTAGLARELKPLASVAIPAEASRVELTLGLRDDPYPRYGVVIETADGRRVWSGAASAIDVAGGRALRVSVPAAGVQPGHYVVTVEGTPPGRPAVPHADYVFRVLPRPAAPR